MLLPRVPTTSTAFVAGVTASAWTRRLLRRAPGLVRAFVRGLRHGW